MAQQMHPAMSPRKRMRTGMILALIGGGLVIVLAIAAGVVSLVSSRERVLEAEWGGSGLRITANGIDVTVTDAPDDPMAVAAFTSLVPTDYLALMPREISTNGEIPDAGVSLSLALRQPLPELAAAAFVFWDDEIEEWVPVATRVSDDRMTLTAVTDHLSVWSVMFSAVEGVVDAVGGVVAEVGAGIADGWEAYTDAWESGVEALAEDSQRVFRFTHELLGNAAEIPECESEPPAWVREVLTSGTTAVEGIDAVLLCMGADPDRPELLQVRAGANRGYGFPVTFADGVTPVHTGYPGLDIVADRDGDGVADVGLIDVLGALSALPADVAGGFGSFTPGSFVFATQEFTASFDEQTLREAGAGRVLSFELPSLPEVMISSAVKLVFEEFDATNEVVSALLTVNALAQGCGLSDLAEASADTDAPAVVVWLAECASAFDYEDIADWIDETPQDATEFEELVKDDVDTKVLRKVAAVMKRLFIVSVAQTVIDYIGDWQTESLVDEHPAWFAQVILAPEVPSIQSLAGTYSHLVPRDEALATWGGDAEGVALPEMLQVDGYVEFSVEFDGSQYGAIRDCLACGSVSGKRIESITWNGSCYDLASGWYGGEPGAEERWADGGVEMLCPAGFGGPGDDTKHRLLHEDAGFGGWYVRSP